MKPNRLFCSDFRRAATFFPTADVVVEAGGETWKPDGFCPVSFDPPIIALAFDRCAPDVPGEEFSISSAPAKLDCTRLETKEIGDHRMLFAAVQQVEIRGGPPSVKWRRASFKLRLDYPFLESADALEAFVDAWRSGTLPKSSWTHAAHVAVTGYHAFNDAPESVFAEMKRGILHFNSCTGVVNGPDSGYHETLTRFWSNTITLCVRDANPASRLEAASCAVRRFGEDRDLPTLFYSFDVVRDRRARAEWVPPHPYPLPEWCGL